MAFVLSMGFDTADGVTMLPLQPSGSVGAGSVLGTPTPTGCLYIYGINDQTQLVQELSDSPEIERAEQCTFVHTFITTWANGLVLLPMLSRGVFVTDSFGNIWRILSAKLQKGKGKTGKLSIVAESISFDSPPDDYSIEPTQLGINIIKHPRYFWALNPSPDNPVDNANDFTAIANPVDVGKGLTGWTVAEVKGACIRAIQNYIDSPFQPSGNTVASGLQLQLISALSSGTIPIGPSGIFPNITNTTALFAIAAAGEIIQKLWKNEDTPYLPGWTIKWTQYYFAPAFLNPGAYIEDPTLVVPDYFISPQQDGSNTIFDHLAAINPQAFSSTGYQGGSAALSSLRQSDSQDYQRTWFAISMTWVISAVGTWDTEIFSGGNRPSHQPYDPQGILGFIPLPVDPDQGFGNAGAGGTW
jgi:hypothetical protein